MIDDIFKRVDVLPRDLVPDAWVLSPTQSLTMGDVRYLVAQVRNLMLALENKKRDELLMVAAQIYALADSPRYQPRYQRDAVQEARALIAEVDKI